MKDTDRSRDSTLNKRRLVDGGTIVRDRETERERETERRRRLNASLSEAEAGT